MAKKAKKRGVKLGTKRGPYKKHQIETLEIDTLTAKLREAIVVKIKHLNDILKRIK